MEIRVATGDDAHAIEAVRVRGWQVAYRHVFPAAELDALPVDGMRCGLGSPPAPGWATFVAVEDERRRASQRSVRAATRAGSASCMRSTSIPDAWSTGVGKALLRRAEEQLRPDYDEATLWVLEDNPRARRFYEAAGWAPDGAQKTEDRLGVSARGGALPKERSVQAT